jgi:hypothetical protein
VQAAGDLDALAGDPAVAVAEERGDRPADVVGDRVAGERGDRRDVLLSAAPGSEDAERLALLSVIGSQTFDAALAPDR